jgi:hypothetical protein
VQQLAPARRRTAASRPALLLAGPLLKKQKFSPRAKRKTSECDRKSPSIRFFLAARKKGSTGELQPAIEWRNAGGGAKQPYEEILTASPWRRRK